MPGSGEWLSSSSTVFTILSASPLLCKGLGTAGDMLEGVCDKLCISFEMNWGHCHSLELKESHGGKRWTQVQQ